MNAWNNSRTPETTLLTEREAAAHLHLKPRTLQSWRLRGIGPPHVRISPRAIRYRLSDLDAYIQQKVRLSTSDDGSGDLGT